MKEQTNSISEILHQLQYLDIGRCRLTKEGGFAIRLTNKTGSASVKGTVVIASATTDNAFNISAADELEAIGVVYESGIADGQECWVIIAGIAEVLLEDTTASTHGNWARTSITDVGRADITNAAAPGHGIGGADIHFHEIGHCIESKGAGTDVLAKIVMHFN
jgi:hypothetical protein